MYSEYQTLAPMYTFEFWLETLSKSSIGSSSLLHDDKRDSDIVTENDIHSKVCIPLFLLIRVFCDLIAPTGCVSAPWSSEIFQDHGSWTLDGYHGGLDLERS